MMWSRMPVWARPVRTLARSALNAWTLLSIFWSVVFFRSAITITPSLSRGYTIFQRFSPRPSIFQRPLRVLLSYVNQGALILAQHHAAQGVFLENVEHIDRQLLVAAQGERGGVHDLEVLVDG